MKTSLKTKLLIAGNIIAVVAIAAIILLHNFQDSEPVEQEVLSFSENVERVSFHPMIDQDTIDQDTFSDMFDQSDSDDESENEDEEDGRAVEDDTEEVDKAEENLADAGAAAEEETTTQSETENLGESSVQSGNSTQSRKPSSSQSSGSSEASSGSSASSTHEENSTSPKPSTEESIEKAPPQPDCNKYQTPSDGKCVDKNYASIVQAKLSSPFSAEGGNPITIKYDGVGFGEISPGQVVEDGKDIKKGAISSLGGINYTEGRKEKLRAQLSGLIH